MSFGDSLSLSFGKSQYTLDIEAKNEGMLLEPRYIFVMGPLIIIIIDLFYFTEHIPL